MFDAKLIKIRSNLADLWVGTKHRHFFWDTTCTMVTLNNKSD